MENWYKKAQIQSTFPFHEDKSIQTPNEEYQKWLQNNRPQDIDSLMEIVETAKTPEEIKTLLQEFGNAFVWKEINFAHGPVILINKKGDKNKYIMDDLSYPDEIKEIHDWLNRLNDHELDYYVPSQDFNKIFWNNEGISTLYHATSKENAKLIEKIGLSPKNESRGINNRGTPAAVFTSDNPDDISSYGDIVFEINVRQMKADGYMPNASRETPTEEVQIRSSLAYKIGLPYYELSIDPGNDGISEATVVFYGQIPPKYLTFL